MKKLLFGMMATVWALSTGMTPAQGADSKFVAAGAEVRAETSDISLAVKRWNYGSCFSISIMMARLN